MTKQSLPLINTERHLLHCPPPPVSDACAGKDMTELGAHTGRARPREEENQGPEGAPGWRGRRGTQACAALGSWLCRTQPPGHLFTNCLHTHLPVPTQRTRSCAVTGQEASRQHQPQTAPCRGQARREARPEREAEQGPMVLPPPCPQPAFCLWKTLSQRIGFIREERKYRTEENSQRRPSNNRAVIRQSQGPLFPLKGHR